MKEYYGKNGKRIKTFVWLNGRRVPIYDKERRITDLLKGYKEKTYKQEKREWDKQDKYYATCDKVPNAFLTKTGSYNIDEALKDGNASIVWMSPKEYMQTVAYDFHRRTLKQEIDDVDEESAERYAEDILKRNRVIPLPFLDYSSNAQQEGRHRVLGAYLAGYDIVPVVIVGRR